MSCNINKKEKKGNLEAQRNMELGAKHVFINPKRLLNNWSETAQFDTLQAFLFLDAVIKKTSSYIAF